MIRKIKQEDVNQIYDLEKQSFHLDQQYKNIEELIKNDNYLILGYFKQNKLVSYLIGIRLGHEYEILKIATHNDYRNKGYASALLNEILKDFDTLYLEVDEANSNAIKFYLEFGFKKNGIRKSYYKNNHNALNLIYKCH